MSQDSLERTPRGVTLGERTGLQAGADGPIQDPVGNHGVRGSQKKRVCFDGMATEESMTKLPRKRLRSNQQFAAQVRFTLFGAVLNLTDLLCLRFLPCLVFVSWLASSASMFLA